jgi:type IV pilus assembly protein PilY1
MKINTKLLSAVLGFGLGTMQAAMVFYPPGANAEVSSHTLGEFTQYPILSSAATAVTPMVMINTSNDHQLYYKAYNDFTDLDPENGDGVETSYKHSIDYYGYFDSSKCYDYSTSDERFEPASVTADKYCAGNWSGNFLNWASMSRMDAIRKILFGGARRTDTATTTVLERTYLPNDAHSWAKYYTGSDIDKLTPFGVTEITLCNTTVNNTDAVSEDVTDPPLIRVAQGNYALWASNERWQCRWSEEKSASNANNSTLSGLTAQPDNPSKSAVGLGSDDYVARVQACVSTLIGKENCKYYPSGNYKPIGLLQTYGENDRLLFGMMGGSYTKNKSGGILIKDVGSITDEIDKSNGTFSKVSSAVKDGGIALNKSEGIINTWSTWRIVKYKHSDGTYGTSGVNSNNCAWGETSFTDGFCMNWGNPYAEIFLNSLRYFAGEAVSGTFRTNDSSTIRGLNTPQTWDCPLDESNYCASLNIINFNASVISYDADNLDDTSDGIGALGSSKNSSELTDVVGAGEGIHGNSFFVGENGTDNNQLCTAKTISSLGSVEGICSEAPRLDGSYRVAGLAHWAHTNDIRPASAGPRALPEDQKVDSYSVALASGLPQMEIPVPGSTRIIRLLPACRDNWDGSGTPGNCAIVDFKVVQKHQEVSGTGTGKFYVNWEDTEQGGDYDQDMWGVIEYEVTGSTLKISTNVVEKSTPYQMGFGYVLSGTENDGFHVHSGINGFDYTDTSSAPGCADCQHTDAATAASYTIGSASAAGLLKDPLYYAAKWGGFTDLDGNGEPGPDTAEWDNRDADWVEGNSDGIPDNYFYATNPAKLEEALRQVFEDILSKVASGTAAAVVSNSREGQGAIYQALYETERIDGANSVKWIGTVRGFWIDAAGYMREDTNGNGILDVASDKVFELCYAGGKVKYRYIDLASPPTATCEADTSTSNAILMPPTGSKDISDLTPRPIWDAGINLMYKGGSAPARNIYTWVDADHDGVVDTSERINLSTTDIDSTNFGFLDVVDEAAADELVEYARGTEKSGMRSRTLSGVTYLLGDIVNSTPTVVGAPAEAFHLLYQDESYNQFRKKYTDRRNVVYVGANDGMLHAFNAGVFGADATTGNPKFDPDGKALGEELWAYVPMNLLPHLKWLSDPDYTHVFYMDAKPRVFDAKIFTADTDHPGGWGTVLVAGMRLGGGPMTIDTGADGFGDASVPPNDITMQSSYVVMDITNPEVAPKVLAEITAPNLGYTTSYPTAFAVRELDDDPNKWYLVFGSGPNNPGKAIRDDGVSAGLYIYDLNTKSFASGYGPKDLGLANYFVGDPVSVDWNLSFKADALYFGTTGGTALNPIGKLFKMALNKKFAPVDWDLPKVFFDPAQPITPTPTVTWDDKFNKWVYFGTGRMFVEDDQSSTGVQSIYGIRDPEDDSTLPVIKSKLVNVTGVKVYTNQVVTGPGSFTTDVDGKSGGTADGTVTFKELEDYINTYDSTDSGTDPDMQGWYKDMPSDPAGVEPSTRSFNMSALTGSVLFTSAYTPGNNICEAQGESSLYGLYYLTGTASPDFTLFGLDSTDTNGVGGEGKRIWDVVGLGAGMSSSPSIHVDNPTDTGGESAVTVITQTGVGSIERRKANVGAGIKSGEVSWREELIH